ncbi:M28 family peptidase [Danxiaibacter flavus]|uniref:M28 family peptidase n=1 Tax=Danxiaibacter flavus TaxID=3049108 RepID=A0ABV3ZBK4_9BACT|nr:M28 family peptidase [Chitinophagaceae bacterium DXS]
MKKILFVSLAAASALTTLAQDGIKGEKFLNDVSYLASDKLQGRFPGTKGNKMAAKYIARQFKDDGLKKAFNSYYQPFDVVVKLEPAKNNFINLQGAGNLTFSKDYSLFSFSGNGKIDAPVIWIGNNVEALNATDIQHKCVAVWRSKTNNDYDIARQAGDHGAAAVIFITPDTLDVKDVLVRLRPGQKATLGIPVFHLKRRVWEDNWSNYFSSSRANKNENSGKTSSVHITAFVDIQPKKVTANNIVGIIEGSDDQLKNEYIVLGAHYDHLGWGGYGTGSLKPDTVAIHNGADDNASGTSALLQIARELANNKSLLKRSVLIVSFSAEEEGLLGSSYFVNHLPVDQSAIKVMINMDMVGRLNAEQQLYMGGAGTFPGGVALMKQLGEGSGLNPVVHAGGVGGSDHVSFYRKGISAVGMHTGGHPQYHTPEDDAPLINKEGAELVCRYIYKAIESLANRTEEFKFIKQDGD